MAPIVEIRPAVDGNGHLLTSGAQEYWFALEVHAISYAQEVCAECDIVVYKTDGAVKHRYTSILRAAPEPPH